MSKLPSLRGDVIVFDGHDVARLSPTAWPSLRHAFLETLLSEPPAPRDETEVREHLIEGLKLKFNAVENATGLFSLAEIVRVLDEILEDLTE